MIYFTFKQRVVQSITVEDHFELLSLCQASHTGHIRKNHMSDNKNYYSNNNNI